MAGNTSSFQKQMGPPVTFAGLQKQTSDAHEGGEGNDDHKASDLAADGLNENNFDIVQSPGTKRGASMYVGASGTGSKDKMSAQSMAGMVPQEQYDALKARFIESETATQRKLQSVDDLEKTIKRREEQLLEMEQTYQKKLQEAKNELEQFKSTARETERLIQAEVKQAKEERVKSLAERDETINRTTQELEQVRDARDNLLQEKNKIESAMDEQKTTIEKLEGEV